MSTLSAIDDKGNPVDWWFLYKIPEKSTESNGDRPTGTSYIYFDPVNGEKKLDISPNQISDQVGAVANTLNQIYNSLGDKDMAWFFYNDENPITQQTSYVRGHTKGVLCFNQETAFWLIHSAPKLAPQGKYAYPPNAMDFAQTFLCITLKDGDEAKKITDQMFQGQQPNICLASGIPQWLQDADPQGSRVSLLKNQITTSTDSYADYVLFNSKSGQAFKSIAKNMYWNTPGDDDFYNDLVGPTLTESIEVETWQHTKDVPGRLQVDKVHTVLAVQSVDLQPLDIDPYYEWAEASDHAKLAVSLPGQANNFVCVGDINFTISQEKRSGGTVAFMNDDLWKSLIGILKDTVSRRSSNQRVKSENRVRIAARRAAMAQG